MLFDLQSGKRKRVIQVVYAILALLMGGSLVLFGVGSDAPGGLLDAVGLGSNSSGGDSGYEQQIEDAEAKLQTNPNDPEALLELVRYQSLAANTRIERDPNTGQVSGIPAEARSELEAAADAWRRYLDTKPKEPDAGAALQVVGTFILLGDAEGAARAQRIVAEQRDTAEAWGNLAYYLYADFSFKQADEAAARAVELADPSERKRTERQFAQIAEQARKEKKRLDKQRKEGGAEQGEQQLTDPFGALGGSDAVTPPITPTP